MFAAYGWDPSIGDEAVLERLLALNLQRAGAPRVGTSLNPSDPTLVTPRGMHSLEDTL